MSGPDSLTSKVEFLQKELMGDIHALVGEIQAAAVQVTEASATARALDGALSVSLTKQIETLRGELANVSALAKSVSGQQARTASGGPDTTAFRREIAAIDHRLASLTSTNESASLSNKALIAKIEIQLEQLSDSIRRWSETVEKSLPLAISAEIRSSEWRTAGKFTFIFVVLYVLRMFIVHKFGLPI